MTDKTLRTLRINIETRAEPGKKGLEDYQKTLEGTGITVEKFQSQLVNTFKVIGTGADATKVKLRYWATDAVLAFKETSNEAEKLVEAVQKTKEALGGSIASHSLQSIPLKQQTQELKDAIQARVNLTREEEKGLAFVLERKAAAEKLAFETSQRAAEDEQKALVQTRHSIEDLTKAAREYQLARMREDAIHAFTPIVEGQISREGSQAAKDKRDYDLVESYMRQVTARREAAQADWIASLHKASEEFRQAEAEKVRIEEQAARELQAIFHRNSQISLANLQAELNEEQSARINGANHIKTLQLAADREEREAKVRLQFALAEIEDKIKNQSIKSSQEAVQQRVAAEQKYKAEVTAIRSSVDKLRPTEDEFNRVHTGFINLAKRIWEVNVIWNGLNLVQGKFAEAVGSIIPVGIALDSVRATLESTMGSSAGTESALKALNKEANRTGLEVGNLRSSFKLFQASTSLAGASIKDTWTMFTNMNTVMTALHSTTDETNHVFLALAQIFNKSKVQSEELVKQLGNLLPGAFASFAASMKIETEELTRRMKEGTVKAQRTMLEFTNFMADRFAVSFAAASQMLNADIGRMKSGFTLLGEAVYSVSSGPLQEFVKGIIGLTDAINKTISNEKEFNAILNSIKDVLIVITGIGIGKYITSLNLFKNATSLATAATAGFEASLGFLASPTVIVAGIELLTLKITDYIHASHQAYDSTFDLFKKAEELQRRKTATPAEQLEIDVANDSAVKEYLKVLDLVNEKLTKLADVRQGAGSLLPFSLEGLFTKENMKDLRSFENEINAFAQTKLNLKSIAFTLTPEEINSQSVSVEKAQVIVEWMREHTLELKKQAEENARMAVLAQRQKEEKAAEDQKEQVGEVRKQLARADALEGEAKQLELLSTQAKLRGDIAEQEKRADEARQKRQEAVRIKTEDQYASAKETALRIIKEIEDIPDIKDRFTAGNVKRYKDAMAVIRNLDNKQKGDMAQVEQQFLLEDESSKQQHYNRIASLNKESLDTQVKDTQAAFKKLEEEFANHQLSINGFYTRQKQVGATDFANRRQIIGNNLNEANQYGRTDDIKKLKEELKQLNSEEEAFNAQIGKKFIQTLEQYNKTLATADALYEQYAGSKEEGVKKKFDLQYAKDRQLLQAQLNDNNPTIKEDAEVALRLLDVARENFGLAKEFQYLDKQRQINAQAYSSKLEEINTLERIGGISKLDALRQISVLNQTRIEELNEILAKEKQEIENTEKTSPGSIVNGDLLRAYELHKQELKSLALTADEVSQAIQQNLTTAFGESFASFTDGTKTASEAFTSFATSILSNMSRMAAQEVSSSLVSSLMSGIKGLGGFLPSANGNAFYNGNVVPFAKGGIVDRPTLFPFAKGTGLMGEAGPEAIIPLSRDSSGRLGLSGGGTTVVHNYYNSSVTIEKGTGQDDSALAREIAHKQVEAIASMVAKKEIYNANRKGNQSNKYTKVM